MTWSPTIARRRRFRLLAALSTPGQPRTIRSLMATTGQRSHSLVHADLLALERLNLIRWDRQPNGRHSVGAIAVLVTAVELP